MKTLTGISLILVILLVSLSAYLRLAHSGIGCDDWPQCYGQIGQVSEASHQSEVSSEQAYKQLLEESSRALAWATPLHRLVASVLGLLVLFLNMLAFRQKRHRTISFALLFLTVFLAILGVKSGGLHQPAIIMGNLLGGFSMLGLMGWLWFSLKSPAAPTGESVPKSLILVAVVLLVSQILLGGLTSANFAATSCKTLPDCHGEWWPGPDITVALDLTRTHQVTASGQAIGGPERMAIHQAHRLGALLTFIVVLVSAILAIKKTGTWRSTGIFIAVILLLEFTVGIASILSGLPIILAVAHNWLAALLLLGLLRLLMLQRQTPA